MDEGRITLRPAAAVMHYKARNFLYQAVPLCIVGAVFIWFAVNTVTNLTASNITVGFDFLQKPAGFAIGESLIAYTPESSYGRAIMVGVFNTLQVSVLAILFGSILGLLIALLRLSSDKILHRGASSFINVSRNIPLLLHLFFWYALLIQVLPHVQDAWKVGEAIFISNRGLFIPAWFVGEAPQMGRFNVTGGWRLTPEFLALLIALIFYSSSFIAEIIRTGFNSVPKGQFEAASAVALNKAQSLRYVILPQVWRIIIPPLTSQYLTIVKNSSLAIAIGYADVVSLANITINQTGQAIEGILIIMAVYLTISVSISLLMGQRRP